MEGIKYSSKPRLRKGTTSEQKRNRNHKELKKITRKKPQKNQRLKRKARSENDEESKDDDEDDDEEEDKDDEEFTPDDLDEEEDIPITKGMKNSSKPQLCKGTINDDEGVGIVTGKQIGRAHV